MSARLIRMLVGLAFVVALALSAHVAQLATSQLPVIALDWPLLLHVERATALVGLLSLAGLVWWRAGEGELPIRFGNIEYAATEATTTAELENRVAALEQMAVDIADREIDPMDHEA